MQGKIVLKTVLIQKTYGEKHALRPVSIKLEQGKIIGLLGPNGAGKTTLLKILAGVLEPDSGEIFVNNTSMMKTPSKAKKEMAFLPEENYLFDELSIKEHFEFTKNFYDSNKQEFEDCLKLFGILENKGKRIEELSKGQKRKAAICLAFSQNAHIFLLDEISSGLDPVSKQKVLNILKREREKGRTILFSTHVLDEAAKLCDSFIFINNGKIMQFNSLQYALKSFSSKSIREAFLKMVEEQK